MTAALNRSFASLKVPNYRRYFIGQVVSLSGNWMQMVAELWLVLTLTGSGTAVGIATAFQFLPMLLFGAWGGALADRVPKRRLLIYTQTAMAIPALVLFALTVGGAVETWMVLALIFIRGAINAIDNPTRQSFAIEMVGADRLVSAVGLNSMLIHTARVVGPALAGVLIVAFGVGPCFLINTLSFAAMIVALRGMDPKALRPTPATESARGAVKAALRYVAATPALAIPLSLMAVVGTLSFNFLTIVPLLARFTFDAGPAGYSVLVCAMGVGSIAGALLTGSRRRVTPGLITVAGLAFGGVALLAAAAPTLAVEAVLFALVGVASVSFAASINTWLQLKVAPQMRGRVMALYSIVFLGSTAIGGPLTGWMAEAIDPRATLVLAGAAAIIAGFAGHVAFRRWLHRPAVGSAHADGDADRTHDRGAADPARPQPAQVVCGHADRPGDVRVRRRGGAPALGHRAGGDAFWLMDLFNEIVNSLVLHATDRAALWTVTGDTAYLILIGLTIEISFLFAIAGVVFVKQLPPDPTTRWLGVNNRIWMVLAFSCLCVFVEILLNDAGIFHWEYWFWDVPFVPLIVIFGYATFFGIAAWVFDMGDDRRRQLRVVGTLAAVDVAGLLVFGPVLGWI